ncbi:PAS domain S-box protein [Aurantiacibacter spongiae]|uniref:PAS domain S-box protein n=1 Tax=Aurantiacibacter spongiae TaxID=2488860 RepID=A0A3N5CVL4_9SPHN|nr:PAS domain S-box protein [Aurantiacibacter spongiae]
MVAVGASAGGIEALKSFVSQIPADICASFVILQHLAPDHESQLTGILSRAAPLPVQEAEQDAKVEPGHIYVLTPGEYITLVDTGLFVEHPSEPRGKRMPIDHFMRSLAETAGAQSVGVVLSGTGSDGTLGLRAIKGAGGVSLTQSPETALYDGMPRSAIDAGAVDEVGDIGQLCATIAELARRMAEPRENAGFNRNDLSGVVSLLKTRTGHDFSAYKAGTLARRVRRRMNLLRFDGLNDYLQHLRDDGDELKRLFDDLLINVTSFFRDREVWPAVVDQAIKPLARRASEDGDPVRIWVPACSTGEEAFTLAMLMEEQCAATSEACNWQIFATDLDDEAIAHGREGVYAESISNDVSQERLSRFFDRENHGWRVKKALRERVVFAQQNILSDPPFSKLDFVSCRNLLIYLETGVQDELLETFHFALREGGFLLLGTSETTGAHKREFASVDNKAHLYTRLPGRASARLSAQGERHRGDGKIIQMPASRSRRDRRFELAEQVRRSLLQRYAPAAIAVHSDGEIAYFHGPVRRFLDHPEGEPSTSIYDLLPAPLRSRVREALTKVKSGNRPSHRSAKVRFPDRDTTVCVECEPVRDGDQTLYLVTFIEQEDKDERDAGRDAERTGGEGDYATQLENELAIVREDLQTTVEELETSNEELKASNEEAVAANEELQSANEELETSREELQSLNEELITVNNQLEEKIVEVERSKDDLRNLFTSTRLPVLFLDPDLVINGFTPAMNQLVELREGDIGRRVTDLAFKVADDDLLADVQSTLGDLSPSERQVQAEDGGVYVRRVQPYRTADQRIRGVVVTYGDITEQAEAARLLARRERQQRIIAELSQTALAARELPHFLDEMCALLRVAMDCDYAKVLELDEDADRLVLAAGAGWKTGLVGSASVETGVKSQGGYTLKVEHAVLVTDFDGERRFDPPPLLTDHSVQSGISCLIEVGGKPWGVLGLHDRNARKFTEEDLSILKSAANVAAATIMQIAREAHLARESLLLSLAIKTAEMGAWRYDPEHELVVWDEQLRDMMGRGFTRRKPSRDEFFDMIVEDDRQRIRDAFDDTVRQGTPFNAEFRLRRGDGRTIWMTARGERLVEDGKTTVLGLNADITEAKLAEEQNRFIMRELDHRVKNVLAIIRSIAKITGKNAPTFEEFIKGFERRLHAMARTHSLLADARWQGARLRTLVEDELAHSRSGGNVVIEGEEVAVSPAAAQALSMAFHELTTNALKYGALSVPDGTLTVEWSRRTAENGKDMLDLSWTETGGPDVEAPVSEGFGSTVIERILGAQLQATAKIDYRRSGLVVTCSFPMERLTTAPKAAAAPVAAVPPEADLAPIADARVLVLDDEWLVAEQHARALIAAGAHVVGPYHSLEEARTALNEEAVDLAMLDFNIDGRAVTELYPDLDRLGIPCLIVSGYGSDLDIEEDAQAREFLAKPASPAAMLGRVAGMLRAAGTGDDKETAGDGDENHDRDDAEASVNREASPSRSS